MIPGEIEVDSGPGVEPPYAAATVVLEVRNDGDRPVQVGSHYHLFEVNSQLRLDRVAAYGMRLAIPAGASVRFEPGETHTVRALPIGGERRVIGFHGLVNGDLDEPDVRSAAMARARSLGLLDPP